MSGDYAKMDRLIARFELAARGKVTTAMLLSMGETALDLIERGFATEQDPSGRAWAPRKVVRGGTILTRTGRLRRGFRLRLLSRTAFRITNLVPYGVYHQTGTRTLPQRRMVPARRLPRAWKTALMRAASHPVRKLLAG